MFLIKYFSFESVLDGNQDDVVSAWWQSGWCSQNLHRPFLQAGGFFNYILLRGTIFYYQECNNTLSITDTNNFAQCIHPVVNFGRRGPTQQHCFPYSQPSAYSRHWFNSI